MPPTEFEADDELQVGLWDELPLWSSLAGELLLEHVPLDARRVLDLGCGTGFPTLELAERLGSGATVVGVDPWAAALARARSKRERWPVANAHLVRGDGARLPFPDGGFDLVVSNLGVNNFADPDAAFAECRRVLVRDGALVLSTNLVGHFHELYDAFAVVLESRGDTEALERLRAHVEHRATLAGLERLLEKHRLRIERTHSRQAMLRFADGSAVMSHHFMRLGFVPAWREVAGEEPLEALRVELDARVRVAGELRLTVPLAVVEARAA
jgi:ubiquinone/menaquinone biosynthesis C-methylase UbiE